MTNDNNNQLFTAGEEAILEQACMILNRRHNKYLCKEFRYSKKLILISTDK